MLHRRKENSTRSIQIKFKEKKRSEESAFTSVGFFQIRGNLTSSLPSRLDAIRDANTVRTSANDLQPATPFLSQHPSELLHPRGVPNQVHRYALNISVHGVVHRRRERVTPAELRGDEWQHGREQRRRRLLLIR